MAPPLGTLAALLKNQDLIPRTHMWPPDSVIALSRNPGPSSDFCRDQVPTCCTDIQAGKRLYSSKVKQF